MKSMSCALLALVLCASPAVAQDASTAKAELKDAKGVVVGQASLTDSPNGVLVHVVLTGMPAGPHAFHIHETGSCDAPFTSAGGHFNPASKQHGMANPMDARGRPAQRAGPRRRRAHL